MKLRFLLIVACILFLGACRSHFPKEMPDDFHFILNYGFEARDIINTHENTYTKNMISSDDQTVDMILASEEMQTIYDKMKEVDILNAAEKATKTSCAEPHEVNKLTLTMNGEVYQREWITSYCDKSADNKLENFIEFVHQDIIMPKEEYKKLPVPTGGYD